MDNLRSHVKTVHQGKAGMKRLVMSEDDGDENLLPDSAPESELDNNEVNIVTVTTDDIMTLATEALAGSAIAQLTGDVGELENAIEALWVEGFMRDYCKL